jgi:hypothetical protein
MAFGIATVYDLPPVEALALFLYGNLILLPQSRKYYRFAYD